MERFEVSLQRTHQFFSVVLNFHIWTWYNESEHKSRLGNKYYGIVFCLNIFYHELRIVFAPFKSKLK